MIFLSLRNPRYQIQVSVENMKRKTPNLSRSVFNIQKAKYSLTAGLPDSSEVVIVGGGVVGTSTAYHLAKKGFDVTLLERNKCVDLRANVYFF